jgi:hypothetical protein
MPGKNDTKTEELELENMESKPFTRADFIREQRQASSNEVNIGCIVAEKEEKLGSERKDKEGKFLLGQDNQPLLYPTKFYATLTFMGGTIRTEINPIQYDSLKIGSTYFCKGRIATVKDFGKESLAPVFNEFVELYKED